MTYHQIEDLAQAIASEAAAAPVSPAKSAVALVRHRLRSLSTEHQARVTQRALDLLSPAIRKGDPDWLTLTEAAGRLRTTVRALKRVFRSVEGRRAYGWPRWRGHRWWVARPAVDPDLAPAYFAKLPEAEPWPAESLPHWVSRCDPRPAHWPGMLPGQANAPEPTRVSDTRTSAQRESDSGEKA
jgi:hypothetical protein